MNVGTIYLLNLRGTNYYKFSLTTDSETNEKGRMEVHDSDDIFREFKEYYRPYIVNDPWMELTSSQASDIYLHMINHKKDSDNDQHISNQRETFQKPIMNLNQETRPPRMIVNSHDNRPNIRKILGLIILLIGSSLFLYSVFTPSPPNSTNNGQSRKFSN